MSKVLKPKIIVFGTSRLHRPFCKRNFSGQLINNLRDDLEIVWPRLGYFHTAAEIVQIVKWLNNIYFVPKKYWRYIFRIEPRLTTPLNEFDNNLEIAIKKDFEYTKNIDMNNIDVAIIEISSLTVNYHVNSGFYFHTNPNNDLNIPYNELSLSGFYESCFPDLGVKRFQTDYVAFCSQIAELKQKLPNAKIVIMGHLRSEKYPNAIRDRIHAYISEACLGLNVNYFDNSRYLDQFGWAVDRSGKEDRHHLSHEGELQIGKDIQQLAIDLSI